MSAFSLTTSALPPKAVVISSQADSLKIAISGPLEKSKVVPLHKVAIIAAIFLKIKIAAPNEAAESVIIY